MSEAGEDIREETLRLVAEQNVAFIDLYFIDILGIVKTVTIPVQQLESAIEHGVWFDGSSIEGFARIAESDMYLMPDPTTYRKVPWDQPGQLETASIICNVYTPDGRPFAGDPRHVLSRVLKQAAEMGYTYQVGPELEFFLFKKPGQEEDCTGVVPVPHDRAGYFDSSIDRASHVLNQMVRALQQVQIEVDASHHEVSGGQYEVDLHYSEALQAADNSVAARVVIKAIAHFNNLYATFMPKPVVGINGNGMHVHQNLADIVTGENVFYDPDDPYNLSRVARQFIAGLLDHAPGMIAVLAPLVNSYKRLVPGYEAPVYLSWGRTNRSALVRVPRTSVGKPRAIRVELRCPDPSSNPYLAFAVMLASGLDGIRRKLPLSEAAEEDLFQVDPRALGLEVLPGSLGQALAALQEDTVVQEALGPHVYERFFDAKQQEWNDYRIYVSQWEVERYLTVF
jgi:glutamine synthetase